MSAYEVTIKITPLCSSCGDELNGALTQSRPSGHLIDRDNPYERTDRRVFIPACPKCYVYRNDRVSISEIYAKHQAGEAT